MAYVFGHCKHGCGIPNFQPKLGNNLASLFFTFGNKNGEKDRQTVKTHPESASKPLGWVLIGWILGRSLNKIWPQWQLNWLSSPAANKHWEGFHHVTPKLIHSPKSAPSLQPLPFGETQAVPQHKRAPEPQGPRHTRNTLLHAPSSGLFLATDLATSVRLAPDSVGLASV